MGIRDWPEGERPREKLLQQGAAAVLHLRSDMHLCGFWDGHLYGLSSQHLQLI